MPNDQVNMSQSSNDTIPTAIHVVGGTAAGRSDLLPALAHLRVTCSGGTCRATLQHAVVKTGRTHLMDAMPITLGQELGGWRCADRKRNQARLETVRPLPAASSSSRRAVPPSAPASTRGRSSALAFAQGA